eukprot:1120462-Rhodomonas_salina.1
MVVVSVRVGERVCRIEVWAHAATHERLGASTAQIQLPTLKVQQHWPRQQQKQQRKTKNLKKVFATNITQPLNGRLAPTQAQCLPAALLGQNLSPRTSYPIRCIKRRVAIRRLPDSYQTR